MEIAFHLELRVLAAWPLAFPICNPLCNVFLRLQSNGSAHNGRAKARRGLYGSATDDDTATQKPTTHLSGPSGFVTSFFAPGRKMRCLSCSCSSTTAGKPWKLHSPSAIFAHWTCSFRSCAMR